MIDNVVELPVITSLDIPVERVLKNAAHLETVIVVGYDNDGDFYFGTSKSDGPTCYWLLEQAQRRLANIMDPLE